MHHKIRDYNNSKSSMTKQFNRLIHYQLKEYDPSAQPSLNHQAVALIQNQVTLIYLLTFTLSTEHVSFTFLPEHGGSLASFNHKQKRLVASFLVHLLECISQFLVRYLVGVLELQEAHSSMTSHVNQHVTVLVQQHLFRLKRNQLFVNQHIMKDYYLVTGLISIVWTHEKNLKFKRRLCQTGGAVKK